MNIIFSILISLSFQSQFINVEKRMLKKAESFRKEDFPTLSIEQIYIYEGVYETKKDFRPIFPKLEETGNHKEFLYFYNNGKVMFFVAKDIEDAYFDINQKTNDYNAVIVKKNDEIILYRKQGFHSILGLMGGTGIYKQYLKIINNKIYIQEKNRCYIYSSLK